MKILISLFDDVINLAQTRPRAENRFLKILFFKNCRVNIYNKRDDRDYNHPTVNPLYYLVWWDEHRSMMMGDWGDLDSEYEELVRNVIRSLEPIRLAIIDNLALFGDDGDKDLLDFMVYKCVEEHRHLIMRVDNSYKSDSESEEDDIGDNWRRL